MISTNQLKINHILCSNLVHFAYLVHILSQTERVQGVDFPIKTSGNHKSTTRIDIVADGGRTWIKVIARNPKALNDIAFGRSNYGTKSILDHANSYIEGALDNQYCFQNPTVGYPTRHQFSLRSSCNHILLQIIFDFANPIDGQLKASLTDLGIEVRINGKSANCSPPTGDSDIKKLNIDVTTMMAYVSSLTSGSFNWQFNEPLLTEQAIKESTCPIKKYLDDIFEGNTVRRRNQIEWLNKYSFNSFLGKELIACKSAVSSFLTILETVGGPNEKLRSEKFLPRIKIHPDISEEQEQSLWRTAKLEVGGKIRERTFTVIAFGLYHKALTVTANKGAIEAAKMQVSHRGSRSVAE